MTRVAVVALGKIGLPLAVQIASKGHEVIGVDISSGVVDLVNSGRAPFPGEADLDDKLRDAIEEGRLKATTSTSEAVSQVEVVIVVVPLMTDGEGRPDFSAMDAATLDVAEGLQPGTLISYETTLPVGTTRGRFAPMLQQASGLTPGDHFLLVHSPERVFSGRVFADLRRYPKLVGGIDAASTRKGVEFYESVLDFDDRPDLNRPNGVWAMGSVEAAELAKLAETTYRDVNIALANEFAVFAERAGVDIGEVIDASNSQPFSHIHRPGVAVGGHCIPVYPRFYLSGHPDAGLVETARSVNTAVPDRVVETVSRGLNGMDGKTILILGVSYRGGVKETAYSGVFDLVRAVAGRGGRAVVSDPLYTTGELADLQLEEWASQPIDAVIIQADHREYARLGPSDLPGAQLVYDGRGVLDPARFDGSGVRLMVIGQGTTTS